jgi:hypothetical protein
MDSTKGRTIAGRGFKRFVMAPQTTDVHVNPSDETIRLGPLAVRFLITAEDANGSVALFELTVPARSV